MTKKIELLIILLLLISIPVAINFFSTLEKPKEKTSEKPVVAQTVLAFSPNSFYIASSSGSLNLSIDTGGNLVTAVQVELSYDPKVITTIDIKPGTFFDNPVEFLKKIDTQNGKITYVLAIPPSGQVKSGSGTVAMLRFTANLASFKKTDITILPKTIVTGENEQQSVLKQASGATIKNGLLLPKLGPPLHAF